MPESTPTIPEKPEAAGAGPDGGKPRERWRFRDYAVEDYLALLVFWTLAAVVLAQFFSRYALNSSIVWTEEVAATCSSPRPSWAP